MSFTNRQAHIVCSVWKSCFSLQEIITRIHRYVSAELLRLSLFYRHTDVLIKAFPWDQVKSLFVV